MKLLLRFACTLALAGVFQAAARPFHDYRILAQTGQDAALTGFKFKSFINGLSINDNGKVAFVAVLENGGTTVGEGVFTSDGSATGPEHVSTADPPTTTKTFGSVWINNSDKVAAQYRITTAPNPSGVKCYWKSGASWTADLVAKATTARQSITIDPCLGRILPPWSCPQTVIQRVEAFDLIWDEITMNDSGNVAYVGQVNLDSGARIYNLTVQTQYRHTSDAFALRPYHTIGYIPDISPVIANSGEVVATSGNGDTAPIWLYTADLESYQAIADAANFSEVGHMPGITDDGRVVAFYGDLRPDRADSVILANRDVVPAPVTPGPGIFASVLVNGNRHIVRIAGVAKNHNLDPGERWTPDPDRPDRGQDWDFTGRNSTNPNDPYDWEIDSFIPDAQVSVSGLNPFTDPLKGTNVNVVFVANEGARKGVFVSRLNLFNVPAGQGIGSVSVEAPIRIAGVGQTITPAPGQTFGPITDLEIFDPVNKHGGIAFLAKNGSQQVIIVAKRSDHQNPIYPNTSRERFDPDSPLVEFVIPGVRGNSQRIATSQIVVHATGGTMRGDLLTLTEGPSSPQDTFWTGIHYFIAQDGRVAQVIREADVANHAPENNQRSVGIELEDLGNHLDDQIKERWITELQQRKLALVLRDVALRRDIFATLQGVSVIEHPAIVPFQDFLGLNGFVDGRRVYGTDFVDPTTSKVPGPFESLPASFVAGTKPFCPSAERDPPWCENSTGHYSDGYTGSTPGVIGHGQVWNRTRGRTDPRYFDWAAIMVRANAGLALTLANPNALAFRFQVTDPSGRRTGIDPDTGTIVTDIPGSQFGGTEAVFQSVSIAFAVSGTYLLDIKGPAGVSLQLRALLGATDGSLKRMTVRDVLPVSSPSPLLTANGGLVQTESGATYSLNFNPDDAQLATIRGAGNLPPVAFDDFAVTTSNSPVAINVLANDNDPDAFLNTNSVALVTPPANGTVSVNPTNGIVTYAPTNGFVGTNTFTYTVQDNEGATSVPGTVTVVVTEPVFTTNAPPIAVNDFASTSNGLPVTIDVLANDSDPDGFLDPGTVTLTRAPTNGTATVDAYTGAITYTPNPGFAGTNTFRYTVQDDLGQVSSEATVTVMVAAAPQPETLTSPGYWVIPVTAGATDHRHPRLNNVGGYVYEQKVGTNWQVFRATLPDETPGQVTVPEGRYTEALSPVIADDGSYVCTRGYTSNTVVGPYPLRDALHYPSPEEALTNPAPRYIFEGFALLFPSGKGYAGSAGQHLSISSDARKVIYSVIDLDGCVGLYVLDRGWIAGTCNDPWPGTFPDINVGGQVVYTVGGQVFFGTNAFVTGQYGNINDVPLDNPDIVYVSGTNLLSTRLGVLRDYGGSALTGSWVDINRSGVLIIERLVGTNYQVFKAYTTEPRIVSEGGTNALVGLPYRYDSDNIAEAYGDPELNDPRMISPISWSKVSGPDDFHIDPATGHIDWVPSAPGRYSIQIRAAFMYWEDGWEEEDIQTLIVHVAQSAIELVDAVSFRSGNSPDLLADANLYFSGGTNRIGVQADGASRLVLRVSLRGAETNSFPNLHFVIASSNAPYDGGLSGLDAMNWQQDVPAVIASSGGTNRAVCLYQSPLDFDLASQPVVVQLLNGTNVIAAQSILLRRPPVVLVHDAWTGPQEWPVVLDALLNTGFDFVLADYAYVSGADFLGNAPLLFEPVANAVAASRQGGFAASRVEMVAHGAGGILARLHIQQHSVQGDNYGLGDVHKLITLGTPHGGSWLAGLLTNLKTNDPATHGILRTNILWASEAAGYSPAVDVNQGVVADEAPGSSILLGLELVIVPSHAIATTVDAMPPGDVYASLQFLLGVTNQGDGFVSVDGALGGIASNATTVLPGIPHSFQPSDTNIAALVVGLLREPISVSNRFGFFPAGVDAAQVPPEIPAGVADFGNWLLVSGLTNGQRVGAGQMLTLGAAAGDGRALDTVVLSTPFGALADTVPPYEFAFALPTNEAGAVRLMAAGRDANGQVSLASLSLTVTNGAILQTIEVEPAAVVLTTMTSRQLQVWGTYSDGLRRQISSGAGTRYSSSDRFIVSVNTNGVLTAKDGADGQGVTVAITNGVVFTNVEVTVALLDLPPTAVVTANRTSGPAPLDVQVTGINSRSLSGDLRYHWDFADGTTAEGQTPPLHRFWLPGRHEVALTVTNPQGLVGVARCPIYIEDRLVVNGVSIVLTQYTAYGEVVVTNGGLLHVPSGLSNSCVHIHSSTNILGGSNLLTGLTLQSNSCLTSDILSALDLSVSGKVLVDASSRIDVSGKGYQGVMGEVAAGPGGGAPMAGGCYGGRGGDLASPAREYGSFLDPVDFGSAGGWHPPGNGWSAWAGASGGGVIRIQADCLEVDGTISADGMGGAGLGCGSGGGVQVVARILAGKGMISANGGTNTLFVDHPGGSGGGGGRVAIYYQSRSGFEGQATAYGGTSCLYLINKNTEFNGGAGTVYWKQDNEPYGVLIIDNGIVPRAGISTVLAEAGTVVLDSLRLGRGLEVETTNLLQVTRATTLGGGTNRLFVPDGSALGNLGLTESNYFILKGAVSLSDLVLSNGSVLTVPILSKLDLTVNGQVVVDASSRIDVSGRGHQAETWKPGVGPGGGPEGCGASHGGVGGNSGGVFAPIYGSLFNPVEYGSSGGGIGYPTAATGSAGGGAIRIVADQLRLDGVITADAIESPSGGGGSGGSVYIVTKVLRGSGTIRANGGRNTYPSYYLCGGGGGRVAVYYADRSRFEGLIQAAGGLALNTDYALPHHGGAGTVFLKQDNTPYGELVIDNGGTPKEDWGTLLDLPQLSNFDSWAILGNARVVATNWIRVMNGDPNYFLGLIASNYLQVGGLIVSNTWITGDIMDLEIWPETNGVMLRLLGEPNHPHILEGSTDLLNWLPWLTNTSPATVTDLLDTNAATQDRRFYRGVKP